MVTQLTHQTLSSSLSSGTMGDRQAFICLLRATEQTIVDRRRMVSGKFSFERQHELGFLHEVVGNSTTRKQQKRWPTVTVYRSSKLTTWSSFPTSPLKIS